MLPQEFAEYEFDNTVGLRFGVEDQSPETEECRYSFMILADELFESINDGFAEDFDSQRKFLDLAEAAKGVPIKYSVSDTDVQKVVKIFESIIVTNNGMGPSGAK